MNTKKSTYNSDNCIKKWQLTTIQPITHTSLTHNYVAVAYSQHYKKEVILKILHSPTDEASALQLFNGNGCVKLLDYSPEDNDLLIEYLRPGTTLKTLFPTHDAQAIEIAAHLIQKMQRCNLLSQAQEKGFATVEQWLKLLYTCQNKSIPAHLLHNAQQLSHVLLSAEQELFFLHGDLHHDNILQSNLSHPHEPWLAIDPKGVIGPLEYEIGRFIMNPYPELLYQANAKEIIKDRISKFSEIFSFEKQKLIDWTFVQAVLGACWGAQDNNQEVLNYFVSFAELIGSS